MKNTRTLLFGIFVQAGRRLTASEVIRLAAPLGISAVNVKSHLTRLVAEGALDRSGPVRLASYGPSPGQSTVVEGIAERLGKPSDEVWDGGWLMLTPHLPAQRRRREQMKLSLWFDGFRALAGETYVRPAWPKQWALDRAARYPGTCIYGWLLKPLGKPALDTMYKLDDLDREAHRLARWIRERKIPKRPDRAFALRMEVGGRVARLIGHDPRLPPILLGGRSGLQGLVRTYEGFEACIGPVSNRFVRQDSAEG